MRVATYNVHRCRGRDGAVAPVRTAAVLEEVAADVIALQEVESGGAGFRQLREISERLELHAVAGGIVRDASGDFGNGLLSRWPVLSTTFVDLSIRGREPRGAIVSEIEAPGRGRFRFVATHLGLRASERREQVGRLLESVPEAGEPLVLAGDFNEWRILSDPLRRLRGRFGGPAAPRSFPALRPLLALDRIWAQPPALVRSPRTHRTPLSRIASDHLPVVAEIGLPGEERLEVAGARGGEHRRCL